MTISIRDKEYLDAMRLLGAMYGVKDQNSFLQVLLAGSVDDDKITTAQLDLAQGTINNDLSKLANAVLSMNGSGMYIEELVKAFDSYVMTSDVDDEDHASELANKLQYPPKDSESAIISITPSKNMGVESGYLRAVTIGDVIDKYKADDTNTPQRRSLGVVEMHHPNLNYSNRDALAASVFLQALPSIEISRALPYFDIKVITDMMPVSPKNNDAESNPLVFTNGISIYKFLCGKSELQAGSTVHTLASAIPLELKRGDVTAEELAKEGDFEYAKGISVAGMEIFQSPQTMVDGFARYKDLDASVHNYGPDRDPTNENEGSAALDKFRPLMTIESMNITVAPSVGTMSTKSAELKLTLHDKTRMGDISPLLVPGSLGGVELLIEYGWSHPDTKAARNPYGALINAMRVKEKFGIMNSSYSFTAEGQVNITLKLYSKGSDKFAFDLVTNMSNGKHPVDVVKEVIVTMRQALKSLGQIGYPPMAEMGAPDSLGKTKNLSGLLSLGEKDYTEIENFIKAMKENDKSGNKATWEALTTNVRTTQQEIKNFQEEITKQFAKKITNCTDDSVKDTSDPYLIEINPVNEVTNYHNIPGGITTDNFVSFGKTLLTFVGQPLMESGKFNEVQMIFYPFNEYAMFVAGQSVASYPIKKDILGGIFKKELQNQPSMTIQKFVNLMKKFFINYTGDYAYGLNSYYDQEKYNDDNKRALLKKYTEDKNKGALAEGKIAAMNAAYGLDGVKKFKKPKLAMHLEAVPHKEDASQTILRLHFFDQAATSHGSFASLWSATSSAELGIVGKYVNAQKAYQHPPTKPSGKGSNKDLENWKQLMTTRKARVTNYQAGYESAFNQFKENGLIKKITVKEKSPISGKSPLKFKETEVTRWKIVGGPAQLRGIMARNLPTLKYGTEFSGILNASLSTQNNPAMETIMMQRQGGNGSPAGVVDDGLPMTIKPVTLTLDTFGCPYLFFGQQFFVDFQTNTTIDDVYSITGLQHSISPGEYKTTIKMVPMGKFGQFKALTSSLDESIALAKETADLLGEAKKPE